MTGTFASVGKAVTEAVIEKHNGLGCDGSVFGGAKGQGIHTSPPGEVGRRCTCTRHRVRKPGAIHVQGQPQLFCQVAVLSHVMGRQHGPPLTGIGEADDRWLGIVDTIFP